jgi:multidrug efflux pump subunit AcrA (membrane-fusion protein)
MKKVLLWLVAFALVLVAGAAWFRYRNANNGSPDFNFGQVEYGDMTEVVSATGILEPEDVVAVGTELSGRVVEIYQNARINQVVRAGEALLKLDDRVAAYKLEQTKVAVRAAEADISRAENVRNAAKIQVAVQEEARDQGVGMRHDLEKARLELKAAEAYVESAKAKRDEAHAVAKLAKLALDLTVLRVPGDDDKESASPRTFKILDRKVVLGQLLGPPASAQIFTLVPEPGRLRVRALVNENDMNKVRVGAEASFSVYARGEEDRRVRARVKEILPMPRSVQGAVFYETLLELPNDGPRNKGLTLRPGMTASVDIIARKKTGIWKLPSAALAFGIEEKSQSEAVRGKFAQWQKRKDRDDWRPVWILDEYNEPLPVFVRVGKGKDQPSLQDDRFTEVLDWDPELRPTPAAENASSYPRLITGARDAGKKSVFENPKVKVF